MPWLHDPTPRLHLPRDIGRHGRRLKRKACPGWTTPSASPPESASTSMKMRLTSGYGSLMRSSMRCTAAWISSAGRPGVNLTSMLSSTSSGPRCIVEHHAEAGHRRVVEDDAADVRDHLGVRRLTHQQAPALVGEPQRRDDQDAADDDRGEAVEDRLVEQVAERTRRRTRRRDRAAPPCPRRAR